jgi:hypothetical protein
VSSTGTSTSNAVGAPRCHTSQLELVKAGGGAATGHQITTWALKNTSSATCSMFGYPGITMVDEHGRPMATTDQRGDGFITNANPPARVTLAPGVSGYFGVETYICERPGDRYITTTAIRVIPPDETTRLGAAAGGHICTDRVVIVSPVRGRR